MLKRSVSSFVVKSSKLLDIDGLTKTQVPEVPKLSKERRSMAHWVEDEKEEFKRLLTIHGKNWESIATALRNKTEKQIWNFYQNYKHKLKLLTLLPKSEQEEIKLSEVGRKRKPHSLIKKATKRRKIDSSDEEEFENESDESSSKEPDQYESEESLD